MITILEILKYTIPAIVVIIGCYLIINKFLVSELKRKQIALLHQTQNVTIPMRLQAYERLALFVERIHPRQLVPRVYQQGMNVADLQYTLLIAIKSEFEHNLSQQIYVSKEVWQTVRTVKEQELNMITQIAMQLPPEAPAKELHKAIVDRVLTDSGPVPSEVALEIINEEAKRVLSYGAQA